jgi:hypothetical protein
MTSLLDKIMSRHSPIVVGYSGWEGDVIMTALKRRLTSGLPNNLYWFCYERAGLEPLRAFFRNHADVCLVLPPDAPARESTATTDELPAMAEKLLPGTASQPTLSAQLVLDTFVNNFTAEAPKIFLDPIGFFLDQLTRIIHDCEDTKSLFCYKHVVATVFVVAREAFACPTIARHSVCCSPIFSPSLPCCSSIIGRAVPMAEPCC